MLAIYFFSPSVFYIGPGAFSLLYSVCVVTMAKPGPAGRGRSRGIPAMPILNRAAELHDEVTGWRRHLHAAPELLYEVHGTAAFVAARLAEFGCDEVVTGIGRTGV